MDLNQVVLANLMILLGKQQSTEVDENMLRHMVLNSIRMNKVKFGKEYGELIICADDKNYWRKKYFPYYKAARRKNQEESPLNWKQIYAALNVIREELREIFPYKLIQVDTAEADDIIGTICHHEGLLLASKPDILILSGDKDYIQLHKYANIVQYDPTRKKWIKNNNPDGYLFEHIIKGDAGDGIPNILSDDNSFVLNIRQKPITQKKLDNWNFSVDNLSETELRGFRRNEALIDLSKVPDTIKDQIIAQYEAENTKGRGKLMNFFMEKRLKHLMESITEF